MSNAVTQNSVASNYILSTGAGYLLGSINFGVILSKMGYHDDVRYHGSGNAGATNMTRSFGWGAGALTLAGDMGKALGSMFIGKSLPATPAWSSRVWPPLWDTAGPYTTISKAARVWPSVRASR